MKKEFKGYVAGFMSAIILTCGVAYAATTSKTIQAEYSNIKVYIDNVLVDLKDANGGTVEPFIYNGTTYLPVRGVAQAMDAQVEWDGATQSVKLYKNALPNESYMTSIVPAYEYDVYRYEEYTPENGKTFTMGGKKYSNGFMFDPYNAVTSYALYNLNGKYKTLSFEAGHIDKSDNEPVNIKIYLDGKLSEDFILKYDALPQKYNINLNNALQMKIEAEQVEKKWNNTSQYGFANVVIK